MRIQSILIAFCFGGLLEALAGFGAPVAITATMLLAVGVFTLIYWDVRLPAIFGYGWFPTMPYNN